MVYEYRLALHMQYYKTTPSVLSRDNSNTTIINFDTYLPLIAGQTLYQDAIHNNLPLESKGTFKSKATCSLISCETKLHVILK